MAVASRPIHYRTITSARVNMQGRAAFNMPPLSIAHTMLLAGKALVVSGHLIPVTAGRGFDGALPGPRWWSGGDYLPPTMVCREASSYSPLRPQFVDSWRITARSEPRRASGNGLDCHHATSGYRPDVGGRGLRSPGCHRGRWRRGRWRSR